MSAVRWVLPLLLANVACGVPEEPVAAATGDRSFDRPVALCELDDPKVSESSGLAASRLDDGVWYTHNDSGDHARFFRFDEKGHVDGVFTLKGTVAFDWEDMAAATVDGKHYLYFADIGDNLLLRPTVVIHRVEEPKGAGRTLDQVDRFVLKYPDGRHDAESFFVRPGSGEFYVVTKSSKKPTGVYKATPKLGATVTMEKVGELTLGGALDASKQTTGADVSPDGAFVLIRTYLGAHEFAAGKGAAFDEWVKATPRAVEMRAEIQGEAIAYARNGGGFATTSEGSPCPVSWVKIRP